MKSLFKPQTVDDMMQRPGDGLSRIQSGEGTRWLEATSFRCSKKVGFPDPKMGAPWFWEVQKRHRPTTSFVKKTSFTFFALGTQKARML